MTAATATLSAAAMNLAWEKTWAMGAPIARLYGGIKKLFAMMLREAWAEVKADAKRVPMTTTDAADALSMLENKDRWSDADRDEVSRLRAIVVKGSEAAKRDIISKAAESTITFTKADGSERRMRVQPAALQHHVNASQASDTARRAAKTRKVRHPHLMPVWDADKQAPRSVNLATVSRIEAGGTTHNFS